MLVHGDILDLDVDEESCSRSTDTDKIASDDLESLPKRIMVV